MPSPRFLSKTRAALLIGAAACPLLLALLLAGGLSGCQGDEPQPRRYREIALKSKNGPVRADAPIRLSWTLPDGWVDQPEGDPLRQAGFWAPDPSLAHTGERDPLAVDVSLVQLAGDAGGLDANVVRWLGQVKIPASYAEQVIAAASPVRVATGQRGIVVDFTDILSGDLTESKSIVGAIIQGEGYTVFVKAMGDRERLVKIKPQLLEFCAKLNIAEKTP
jgi:hypothetical protein